MSEQGISSSPIKWFGLTIIIIALTNIAVLLDIPVVRLVVGFIFLTFIPGFLLLSILKLNTLDLLEKIVLSVGLSVAFSMLFGLMLNTSLLAIGYTKPLSTASLLISFSIATIVLAVVAHIKNKEITFSFPNLKLTMREKVLLVVPSLFPLLSIVGMRMMNLTDNNVLLMLLLFLIPAYVIFISFYRHKVPQRLYPSLICLIGISLVLMLSLRSNHIIGSDIHLTYYVFQTTLDKLHWSVTTPTLIDALLSISLLPSIYHMFLNTNQEYLFKVFYSLLLTISPLVVYIIAKKYIGNFYAFIASFFFMSQFSFLWTAGLAQTNTAILFFALAVMVLLHDGVNLFARKLLFIIFAVSCLLSHYSTSYIFFFVLLFTWIGMQIIPRVLPGEKKAATPSENPITEGAPSNAPLRGAILGSDANTSNISQSHRTKGITINIVALFFVVLFFWYSQITVHPFKIGINLIYNTFANLNQWYVLESQGSTISAAVGEGIYTLPQKIRVVVSWLTIAFVALGVLTTVARYKRMVAVPGSRHTKLNFLDTKFGVEHFVLSLACSLILVSAFALPHVTVGYSMERAYFHMLVVLSPFFVVGGIVIARWLRARPHWIVLPVLIPFFMCTTGTMHQISGFPTSIVLNSAGAEYETWYVHDQESYGAKWIKEYSKEQSRIYIGHHSESRILPSQGKIPLSRLRGPFVSLHQEGKKIDGYIYFGYTETAVAKTVQEYPDIFAEKNKIYTSNGSQVYE